MKTKQPAKFQPVSAMLMILALLWLTISTPFVLMAENAADIGIEQNEADDTNPFANTTEEKTESGISTVSEYLFDAEQLETPFVLVIKDFMPASICFHPEFHPEMISPPPESVFS